ncbi:MAG: PIN domain nuclease [Phormidesmis priestleyi]|uniref:PIN domain nuclease n=1 Tax=Phormidesmis priestleyi TaxID=268141 RepID=A0A2W4XE50_9CYAN|nr:MAG: PIN domain nuclease [Phormidesmis priestleyi]
MIAVDTNVVVRLLVKDDELQYAQSLALFQSHSIFLSDTVILETEWVLRFSYSLQPSEISQSLKLLIGLPTVKVTDAKRLAQALQWHIHGLGFADAFHLACCNHCSALYTFDQQFIRRAQSITTLRVLAPS